MQFVLVIYNDPAMLDALPAGDADGMMLEDARRAKTVRVRHGRVTATDGPFAEAKEVLGGFNLIEAADMDEAVRIAAEFPWARTGSVEVRPVQDIEAVRRRVSRLESPVA